MRKLLHWTLVFAMAALAWGATPAKTSTKKKASKSSSRTAKATPAKATTKGTAARKGKKAPAKSAPKTTWRNRQTAPTPERYREIQEALAAKGYLDPAAAGGAWNQTSADALKRFQADQNIEATGKINSLALIALGLGPRHGAPPTDASETRQQ